MKNRKLMLLFIGCLIIASIAVILKKPAKLGLDLIGGSRLVLQGQIPPGTSDKLAGDMMNSLQFSIENRVNKLGVAETVVQRAGFDRLIVEIPSISDPQKAKEYLGETAELEFKEQKTGFNNQQTWVSTGLSGKDLSSASVGTDQSGRWVVLLQFNDKGAKKFGDLTSRLVGKPMAIFFNGELESAPVIREPILSGGAEISGGDKGFSIEEAHKMVDLLNAGALPIPAKIIEENSIGPTLGLDSIEKSKIAGLVGLSLVMLFMLFYYRVPGIIANLALLIYGSLVFAVFKIIPVTLTLAGIAGFILSIGMAVDANILIFERTKEELKSGRTLFTAINAGFDRAFTSIFDSNMTTIIICSILYFFGTSIVKGFALTLAIGVIISMFTAITVTRTFMHLFFGTGQLKHPAWFGLKPEQITEAYQAANTDPGKAKLGILD